MRTEDRQCTGFTPTWGMSRRELLSSCGMGLGSLALSQLLSPAADGGTTADRPASPLPAAAARGGVLPATHYPARAKRVIYLFHSGGPSQMDLFDYKPLLNEKHGTELPAEIRRGQRLTAMSGNQASLPLVGSPFPFRQHGQSGAWVSELLPHTSQIVDDLCFIKSLHTEAINHGPAVTFFQTGSQLPGRPSIGAWLSYGLGTENANLPEFVVMLTKNKGGQPLAARLWGTGFLPSKYEAVRLRPDKDRVLYLNNPDGVDLETRRRTLDTLRQLHRWESEATADPELENRIAQYESAFRMQISIPEATDMSRESEQTFTEYGEDARTPGTYAANCLLARRLAERGVRFIQLYHPGWDQHGGLVAGISQQCKETDQATAALIKDLKQRGLLDDTLVIWGGEFGRTNYCQGKLSGKDFGRDHHPRCFTMWMAGGGVKPGVSYGQTDPYCYNIVEKPVHIHDFHATLMQLLGIDHEQLTFKYQGRRFRLTDVAGQVVTDILA